MTPRRFLSWYGLTVLAGVLLTRLGVTLWPPEREAWNLYAVGADTSALWLRVSRAHTGLYAGQLTTRLGWIPQSQRTLVHRAMHGPGELDESGVTADHDHLRRAGDTWEVAVGSLELQLRGRVEGFVPGCPPEAGRLVGNVQAGNEGSVLDGPALLVRSRARGRVEGGALYVLGRDVSAAVDPLAPCPAWIRVGDRAWAGDVPEVERLHGEVRLGDWTLSYQAVGVPVSQEGLAHVLPPERWLAWVVGFPEPVEVLRRASVRIDGPGVDGPRTGLHVARRVR